jgi:hypothetical protein
MKQGYTFYAIVPSNDGSSKCVRVFNSNDSYAPKTVTHKGVKYYKYYEENDEGKKVFSRNPSILHDVQLYINSGGIAKYHNENVPEWDIMILFGDK